MQYQNHGPEGLSYYLPKQQGYIHPGTTTLYTVQPPMYHEVYDGHDLISEVQWKVLSQTNSRFQFLCFSGHFRSSANACTEDGTVLNTSIY